ncbi:MAG: hypothetical protein ACE5FN_01195 [Leptospirillia bacterium]
MSDHPQHPPAGYPPDAPPVGSFSEPLPGESPEDTKRRNTQAPPQELLQLRLGLAFVIVAAIGFTVGTGYVLNQVDQREPGPVPARDVTTAVLGLFRTTHGQGLLSFQSTDVGALEARLKKEVGDAARIPDLSDSGLMPMSVRAVNMNAPGWGMVRYQAPDGPGDVLAIFGPKDGMLVPAHGTVRQVAGGEMYLQDEPGAGVTLGYVEGEGADWVLATGNGEAELVRAAEALLGTP